MKKEIKKRGQVTIFIIIAIIIIVLGILIYMFYPKIKTSLGYGVENPNIYIQNCIEEEVQESIKILSQNGGSIEPEHFSMYKGERIEYLCYTEEYYKTCVMQEPMLKLSIENEIKEKIKDTSKKCFEDMKKNYERNGNEPVIKYGDFEVELLPKKVILNFNHSLILKNQGINKYDGFRISLNNNIYELISIANSILNWEARYGDAETTTYMTYYRDIKVEKNLLSDGTTIYIITDRNNGKKFQFASRSVAWPPGYGG